MRLLMEVIGNDCLKTSAEVSVFITLLKIKNLKHWKHCEKGKMAFATHRNTTN